jgi:hypothetical protein
VAASAKERHPANSNLTVSFLSLGQVRRYQADNQAGRGESAMPNAIAPTRATSIVLNGTNVGRVTIEPMPANPGTATWANEDKIVFLDRRGCSPASLQLGAANPCKGEMMVAHAPSLNLKAFERNILMVDGKRMDVVNIDDRIQGAGEATRRVLHRLPNISSTTTVGAVSIGAMATRFALGQRNIKSLLVTGAVAAGVAGVAAVGLSWYRARHPYSLPGWLK